MMSYLKLRNGQSELSEVGTDRAKQKGPQLKNQNTESDANAESSGFVTQVRFRVRSQLANIDVFRQTRGQANQVAAVLKSAGIADVRIEEMLG